MEYKTKLLRPNWFRQEEGKWVLVGSHCNNCHNYFFPPQKVCPNCVSCDAMQVVPLSKRGKLISYTIIEIAAPEFKTPYAVGYVDLPEKVRLFSMLTNCEPFHEKLKLDMEVEMLIDEIKKAEDGTAILSYKFKPSLPSTERRGI